MKVNGKDIKDISWEDIKNKELIEEITKKITEEFRECKETDGVEDLF